ncbi:putative electron transfer flavoprotein subunit [Podila epicladia]|nr:putative electron transfer flavoprotein subunit [Podila epicladia]
MSQAETASEPHSHPVDEPVSSSLGATSIAAVDAPPPYTSLESENGNKPVGLTETYPKDNTKMVRIASPSSSSPSSPSSTVLSASTLSSSPETPTTLSAVMTPAMAEVAISTAVVSASNFVTDAPSTPEATISTTTNNESERIAAPSPYNTTSATTSITPPSTTISTAPVVNINKDNKATPNSPLSPLPSPPSSSTMVTDKDKGHPIPTSNALSYSLKSRLSSAGPLSSLSSVTPSSIISPKPYSSYHTTVTSSSLLTSPSTSSQPLSPTKDGRPLNPVSVYSSSSSKSFEQADEEAKDYPPYPYAARVSMSSAKDRYSTSPVYQRPQESEYEDEEEEGDDDEYEMDEEYGSDSGLPMEHDSGLPYEHDTEMAEISTRSSPHPTSTIDASKAASTSTSSPQLAPQEANKATPTTPTSASTSTPTTTATTATPAKKNGVSATSCANCGTTTTPLWRRASDGQTICNACGLYFKARNSTRPPWLKRNMGLKKGDTSTGETEEIEDATQPASSADVSNGDANETPGTGETKGDAESCPGDGNCNGIGGAHTCSGCPSFNQQHTNRQNLICANCRTTTTPLWRRDSSGNTICNACGLYFKLHNVHRPVTMKRAVIKRRKRQDATSTEPGIRGSIGQTQAPVQLRDWSEQRGRLHHVKEIGQWSGRMA